MSVGTRRPAALVPASESRSGPGSAEAPRAVGSPGSSAVFVLGGYLLVLLGIPSALRIPALGLAGSPSTVYGLLALGWWVWTVLARRRGRRPASARFLLIGLGAFGVCVALSYIAANLLSLPDGDVNQADAGVLRLAGAVGIVLVALDGLRDRMAQWRLVRWATTLGAAYGTLGLAQFLTRESFIDRLSLPGLSATAPLGVETRAGFVRAVGTAWHPLEYAAVLCLLLPLALCFALRETRLPFLVRWYPAGVLAACAALSVSRTALIGLALAVILLLPTWPRGVRWGVGLLALVAGSGMLLTVPGMIGTIRGLFSGEDSSLASRTQGSSEVLGYLAQSPVVGRGLGTFQADYHILDNQYLLLLIEVGVLGLAVLLAVLLGTVLTALVARRRTADPAERALGAAFIVALTLGLALSASFDSFSFPQAVGLLFLMLGLCGAFAAGPRPDPVPDGGGLGAAVLRRWWAAALVIAGLLPVASALGDVPGRYTASADVLFLPPTTSVGSRNTLNQEVANGIYLAAIVAKELGRNLADEQPHPVSGEFYGVGMRKGIWVRLPDQGGQWQRDFKQALVRIDVVGGSSQEVLSRLDDAVARIDQKVIEWQSRLGVHDDARVTTRLSPQLPQAVHHPIRGRRAQAAGAAVALVLGVAAAALVDAAWGRRKAGRRAP